MQKREPIVFVVYAGSDFADAVGSDVEAFLLCFFESGSVRRGGMLRARRYLQWGGASEWVEHLVTTEEEDVDGAAGCGMP